ncbi:MAG: hypothetical protein QOJ29_5449 [Thermoleophilaceae bacterium]|jgi:hypothetical protein|nr:hypothetical protein [Thermoleophilaceae bacterium]
MAARLGPCIALLSHASTPGAVAKGPAHLKWISRQTAMPEPHGEEHALDVRHAEPEGQEPKTDDHVIPRYVEEQN